VVEGEEVMILPTTRLMIQGRAMMRTRNPRRRRRGRAAAIVPVPTRRRRRRKRKILMVTMIHPRTPLLDLHLPEDVDDVVAGVDPRA
jgi:hypothetical protein